MVGRRFTSIIVLLSLFLIGCTNDSFSITSIDIKPLVSATYDPKIGPMLSEGVAVVVASDTLDGQSEYQMAVSSPGSTFTWEKMVKPFEVDGHWYVGLSDLLLPSGFQIDSGQWSVELYPPEGERVVETFLFSRPTGAIDTASLTVSTAEDISWEPDGDQWLLIGPGDVMWQYRFYDAKGMLLTTLDSDEKRISHPVFTELEVKEHTRMVVARRFDESAGVYLMIRWLFT